MRKRCRGAWILLLAGWGLAAPAEETVRVMTFNLRYASAAEDQNTWKQWDSTNTLPQRRQFVFRVITNRAPDVIGFQEGEDRQLADLRTNLPAQYMIEQQRPSGGSGNENAAFAYNTHTVELLDRGVFSLGPSPGGGYWNNPAGTNFQPYLYFTNMGLGFPRLALWRRFRWRATGQEFLFYTTHFDFNNDPQVASARLIADDALARAGRRPLSPLAIVVGDFNSCHTNNDWKLFTGAYSFGGVTGDFTDAWYQVHGTWTDSGSFHGWSGGTPAASWHIDWILHRGGFAATQTVVVTDSTIATNKSSGATYTMYPSDHYPVLSLLRLPAVTSDYDGDGLPDGTERGLGFTNPVDADTDGDGLLDGEEDLNGNGSLDGGETDPATANAGAQLPTDLRTGQMDGILDYAAGLAAENSGMSLYYKFDGRYLYAATWDAGEGQDHFLFVVTNPNSSVSAPWAKSGQVPAWIAYLADENDHSFAGWFNAAGAHITDTGQARSAAYFENGGRVEGVLDVAAILGAGFTQAIYLAVAPYGTSDGDALQSAWQAPAGNGDGNLWGSNEFFRLPPGDADGDGVNDAADPDADGDGLLDRWEQFRFDGLDRDGDGDADGDGALNGEEWRACTDPMDSNSVFGLRSTAWSGTNLLLTWPAMFGKSTTVYRADTAGLSNGMDWPAAQAFDAATNFPCGTNEYSSGLDTAARYLRVGQAAR